MYFTERGRVLSARNEEIWSGVQARKTFSIEPTPEAGGLYLFAFDYPGNDLPLAVDVNGTALELVPDGDRQGLYSWRGMPVPAGVLDAEAITVTLSCAVLSMSAWILAVDTTGHHGGASGAAYTAWEVATILGWTQRMAGHGIVRAFRRGVRAAGAGVRPRGAARVL